ncbi:hypothetical protein JHU04_001663 [Brenneria sp. 4F2]|nr:hypothetical protein [Brenneria bubanii]
MAILLSVMVVFIGRWGFGAQAFTNGCMPPASRYRYLSHAVTLGYVFAGYVITNSGSFIWMI